MHKTEQNRINEAYWFTDPTIPCCPYLLLQEKSKWKLVVLSTTAL